MGSGQAELHSVGESIAGEVTRRLMSRTGAGTACGSCRSLVCELAGAPAGDAAMSRSAKWMLAASAVGLAAVMVWVGLPPVPMAESVRDSWRQVDVLWRDDWARQITGYTTLGLMAAGLVFSLRKRWGWFRWGSHAFWRVAHGVLGTAMLVAVAVHSVGRIGENLNAALSLCLIALAMLGVTAGAMSSLEARVRGDAAMMLRRWRPRLTAAHTWLFWPLPTLIAAHVLSFYWFSS